MSIRKRKSAKAHNGHVFEVYIQYTDRNGIKQKYTKRGFVTKKEAERHEAEKKAEILEYGTIQKEVKMTLNELMEEFYEIGSTKYQANTIYNTRRGHTYFKDSLGKMQITKIDFKTLQTYFNKRKNEGKEINKTIKKALNRAFNHALRAGYIKTNPLQHVEVTGIENHVEKTTISTKNFYILINELKNKNDFRYDAYAVAIQIAFYTGLRVSEVFALEKKDFDFINSTIDVNKKLFTKGLKSQDYYTVTQMKSRTSKAIIPFPEVLKPAILEWFNMNPYERIICNENGVYLNPDSMMIGVKKIAKEKGFTFNFHMLRHTYCTNLFNAGVDIKTAQELMRHSDINTTMSVYTHLDNNHKKDVVNDVFSLNGVKSVLSLN